MRMFVSLAQEVLMDVAKRMKAEDGDPEDADGWVSGILFPLLLCCRAQSLGCSIRGFACRS